MTGGETRVSLALEEVTRYLEDAEKELRGLTQVSEVTEARAACKDALELLGDVILALDEGRLSFRA